MDRKQMCVANVQYKQPSADGAKQSKNLLRYLTYRESRDEKARHVTGRERWTDRGMGRSVGEIIQRCDDLKSDHVLAFSLVVNPNPDLIALVAPEERECFVGELTEGVVGDFFEARGLDTGVEFSYVLHHRLTDDPQAPGLHDPHTHVVLPGTVYDEEHGGRVPLFFSRNRQVNHIELLHDVTERAMAAQMERYVGPDWEERIDTLLAVREREQGIVNGEPHGWMRDDAGDNWPVWCGTRRTDETTAAVGTYRWYPDPVADDDGTFQMEFRPLLAGLPTKQAVFFARAFARELPMQNITHQRDENSAGRSGAPMCAPQGGHVEPPLPTTSVWAIFRGDGWGCGQTQGISRPGWPADRRGARGTDCRNEGL